MSNPSSTIVPLFGSVAREPVAKAEPKTSSLWSELPPMSMAPRSSTRRGIPAGIVVDELIAQARKDAETMTRTAQSKAQAILAEARAEAETARQDAFVDGYSSGLTNAHQEVEADLTAKFEERCKALQAGVDEIVEAILADRELLFRNMDSEITSLALEIAKKIVKVEITQNPEVVKGVIQDALRRVTERSTLRILINPDELQNVRDNREDILAAIDGVKNLEIDGDRRVGRGGCVIETNAGSIDAKIETQLEQVETALHG